MLEQSSFSTGPAPNRYDYMIFSIRLWFTYGSLRNTGAVWRSEPVHLEEQIRTHVIQRFIFIKEFTFFYEPSEGTVNNKRLRLVRNFFCSCCCTFSILLGYVIYVNVNMLIEINSQMGTNWSKFFTYFC